MCKVMEDMRNETALRERKKMAVSLLNLGKLTHEEIVKCSGLSLEEIKILAKEKGA